MYFFQRFSFLFTQITSIKILASVLRWCVQSKADGLIHSAESFLWKFCWKIITTPAPISEVLLIVVVKWWITCIGYIFHPLFASLVVSLCNCKAGWSRNPHSCLWSMCLCFERPSVYILSSDIRFRDRQWLFSSIRNRWQRTVRCVC